MKNKLQFLYLFIFCIAAITNGSHSASAQTGNSTDKTLVAGKTQLKQSEVDKLIEFYEWAFETRFTASERERYQTFVMEGFRQNAASSRKDTDTLISALSSIRSKDSETQARMREMFTESFVKDLRASNDEGSQLLLSVYKRGQSYGIGSGHKNEIADVMPGEDDLNDAPKSTTRKSGLQKLVGTWTRSDGTGGASDGTGKTRYNSGTDTIFEFFANGTMRLTIKKEALSITQCNISETTKIPGSYSISGTELTMNLGAGTVVGKSSCGGSGNFSKSLTASVVTKPFVIKNLESPFRPDAPLILCLDNSVDSACFERDPNK